MWFPGRLSRPSVALPNFLSLNMTCSHDSTELMADAETGGGLFNHFDGSVDLLDDLDDHYTARTHKKERNGMIERFQEICKQCKSSATTVIHPLSATRAPS